MPLTYAAEKLPPAFEKSIDELLQRARAVGLEPYRPPPRDLERLAPMPPEMQQISDLTQRGVGSHAPAMAESQRMLQALFGQQFPQHHREYMNPYEQHVVRGLENEAMRTFNERVLPALENQFVRRGQHGSTQHRNLALRAARDIQQNIGEQRHKALAHGYETAAQQFAADQAKKLYAAREMTGLAPIMKAANLADLSALESIAGHKHGHAQTERNIRHEEFLREQSHPREALNLWQSIVHGLPFATATQTFSNPETAPPRFNAAGQTGQLASSLFGLLRGARG
jgi:hypothetical protein